MQRIKSLWVYNQDGVVLILTTIFLLTLGAYNAFIQDDAFISFRYAENFAQGNGLIWNAGDTKPVEGYTNFLWILLMSVPIALDLSPVLWSMIFGFIFGSGTLYFTYRVSFKITHSHYASLLSIVLLGTNYTFSSYLTGGLETQLQAFLVVVSVYVSLRLFSRSPNEPDNWILYPVLSVLFSLAAMTRLDSILICGILLLAVSYSIYNNQEESNKKLRKLKLLVVPGMLIVGTWLLFKCLYYGDILPNTYYVKATGSLSLLRGLIYTSVFFVSYGLFPFLILGMLYFSRIRAERNLIIILSATILVWILYVIKVSGDFMEFRFFVPIAPLLYILISIVIFAMSGWMRKAVSIFFLLVLSPHHGIFFEGVYNIESIRQLNAHIVDKQEDWQTVGRVLGDMFFDSSTPVVISTTAAGAIPYYSKLPTIDMLGLNDKWIAKNGMIIGSRPGHTRYTTIQYLIDSKVDLVLGHPKVRQILSPATLDPKSFFWGEADISILPNMTKVIQIPLNSSFRVDVLYISKNNAVDKAIQQFGLVTNDVFTKK